jgi:hypothetical protein
MMKLIDGFQRSENLSVLCELVACSQRFVVVIYNETQIPNEFLLRLDELS